MAGQRFDRGLVLADDATGALECASLLASMQLEVLVTLRNEPGPLSACSIVVADTGSRHVDAEQAAGRIRLWMDSVGGRVIFKKTDSTLRGNIAAELLAMRDALPLVYVPAYPAMGRSVKQGRLYVHGTPVAETEFARDARQPVRSSIIRDLFPAGLAVEIPDAAALASAVLQGTSRILICDSETDQDLERIARVLQDLAPRAIVAGPAGFIRFWAGSKNFAYCEVKALPRIRDWLIVCGSLHPTSRRQARIAQANGIPLIASGEDLGQTHDSAAAELAKRALDAIGKSRPQAILVMGGDTARALWNAMGVETLVALPEVLPGAAACHAPGDDLVFVTKAGGFGDDGLVASIQERFTRA